MLSEANGALMRVSPIPIFFFKEPYEVIAQYARLDACLSHPLPVCQDCNAVYCVALASLICNSCPKKALVDAGNWVSKWVTSRVEEWFYVDRHRYKEDYSLAQNNIGHVKHEFCMSMNSLEQPSKSYLEGIRNVLKAGGDTDTNACVGGAILGGIHKIPEDLKDNLLNYQWNKGDIMGHNRPQEYTSKAVQYILHCM